MFRIPIIRSNFGATTVIKAFSTIVKSPIIPFKCKSMIGGGIKEFDSNSMKGKYWVLFFYPLDFTFVCPTEITGFNDKLEEFKKLKTSILGCSIDSEHSHLAWSKLPRNQGGIGSLGYPLLSDLDKEIAKSFGILTGPVSLRATFIMDKHSIVRHATINDLGIGRNIDETLRTLKAIQHNDEHGEVCPANWTSKHSAIRTDRPSDYFAKLDK